MWKRYLLAIAILIVGCGQPKERFLDKPPARIVSLAPSITEDLYLLGQGDKIVGVTIYCNYPEAANKKEEIGTILQPNIEKIVSLKPDLVLATKDANRPQTIERLKGMGLKVTLFEESQDFNDIRQNFLALGRMVDKEEKASQILKEAAERIELIRRKTQELPKTRVFFQLWADPLVTASALTFPGQIIELAGGINIAHQAKGRYPLYSLEEVVRADPEVIIIALMGSELVEDELKDWQRFSTISAVKNGRVYQIDPDLVCRPTPLRFVQGLEEMARLIHPEAFKRF